MVKNPTSKQQEEVLAIYNEILRRSVTRDDVRRRAAKLAIDIGGGRNYEMARSYLLILEKVAPNDGEIEFLLGRCYEEEKEAAKAAEYYEKAIAHGAPARMEGFDLRLMSWGDGAGVPTSGNDLVIVGTDTNNLLHIRVFDSSGKRVTDTDETKLPSTQAAAILALKQQIPALLAKQVLSGAEKAQVLGAATSIVGQIRLDASRRLAALLHSPLKRQEPVDLVIEALVQAASFGWASSPISSEADRVIEAMVAADPKNYRVYLERGRYRRQNMLLGAEDDFKKALELAPKDPEIYLEAAQLAESTTGGLAASRQFLDKGLAAAPESVKLYQALFDLERRAGRIEEMIKTLEDGVKAVPGEIDRIQLRYQLAQLLAGKGETGKLQLQIQELKDLGVNPVVINYFTAYYHANNREYARAQQILGSLQAEVARMPDLKASVNVLLARCYGELRQPERQWDAFERGFRANPNDLKARLPWINGIARRGDIEGAIREYERLDNRWVCDQGIRVPATLVQLMLTRNAQRPLNASEWRKVDVWLDEAEKDASRKTPASPEVMVLRAKAFAERDQDAKARDMLATARVSSPKPSSRGSPMSICWCGGRNSTRRSACWISPGSSSAIGSNSGSPAWPRRWPGAARRPSRS